MSVCANLPLACVCVPVFKHIHTLYLRHAASTFERRRLVLHVIVVLPLLVVGGNGRLLKKYFHRNFSYEIICKLRVNISPWHEYVHIFIVLELLKENKKEFSGFSLVGQIVLA